MQNPSNQMIGKPVRPVEDRRLLTGQGRFTDDSAPSGALVAGFARSSHAFADIVSIDTQTALRSPGVVAVIVAQDLEDGGVGPIPTGVAARGRHYPNRDGSIMADPPYFPLAHAQVRHVGDAIAMVVATDPETLQSGVGAVTVAYRARDAIVHTDGALADDAPLI